MVTRKLALAVVHGVGSQITDFASGIIGELKSRFADGIPGNQRQGLDRAHLLDELVCVGIHWASVLPMERTLYDRLQAINPLDWSRLRRFMIGLLGDAVAYQPLPDKQFDFYDQIHQVVADGLGGLASHSDPNSPLTIIAHSLGSVIVSNFIWDAQHGRPTVPAVGLSPLSRCETLTNFYTLGSPLAIWSLRYPDFGVPVSVPSAQAVLHGEWVNFFDDDDVIACPLQNLNSKYNQVVRDREVNVGGWLSSWNPISHNGYWTDNDVTAPIARKLSQDWVSLNS
jgi:hypothetical protein